jgi:hypothetical protein
MQYGTRDVGGASGASRNPFAQRAARPPRIRFGRPAFRATSVKFHTQTIRGLTLKLSVGAAAIVLLSTSASAADSITYDVAHIRRQDVNMVFVKISPNFFNSDPPIQAKWYTGVQQCVRASKLAGEAVVVSNFNGRFMFYGPKDWKPLLQTIDMKWVNARVNKAVTCKS